MQQAIYLTIAEFAQKFPCKLHN